MCAKVMLSIENECLNKTYQFEAPSEFTVGRATGCDYEVPNIEAFRGVSQSHCVFEMNPPRIWIRDLESKEGTFVNELKISSLVGNFRLYDQDEVQIGPIRMTVRIVEQAPANSRHSSNLMYTR